MARIKVAVLGAGSFVFGPSVLKDAIIEQKLDDIELALMDPNRQAVDLMAGVGQRLARELGVEARITGQEWRAGALDGADFVICAAAGQLRRRFELDREIVRRHCPGHMVGEFGGIAGISYSLRQIAMIREIATDMKRLCPKAWLLDVSNPLPRVAQTAHEEGIPTVGFSSVSLRAYGLIWHYLRDQAIEYPFEPARSRFKLLIAGLNHFSWVLSAHDASSGEDLYPRIREVARQDLSGAEPVSRRLLVETGYLPAPGDENIRDFVEPRGESPERQGASQGSLEERQRRLELLKAVAEGREAWQPLFANGSWERPASLIAAMAYGRTARFEALDLSNEEALIESLPRSVFVETPAVAEAGPPQGLKVELPQAILSLCQRAASVTDAIVRAASRRQRRLVHEAVELDPTVIDKTAGMAAIDECLLAHRDVLPTYQ